MQAYQAGLQAFQARRSARRKDPVSRRGARTPIPSAYQAQYSLGVVQERLGSKVRGRSQRIGAATGIVKDYEAARFSTRTPCSSRGRGNVSEGRGLS